MSKIAEQKAKDIAKKLEASQAYKFDNFSVVCGAIEGYDQAMQDFLEKADDKNTKIKKRIEGYLYEINQQLNAYYCTKQQLKDILNDILELFKD